MNSYLAEQDGEWTLPPTAKALTDDEDKSVRVILQKLNLTNASFPDWSLYHKTKGPPNNNWYCLCLLDVVTVILFARCLWKSYETISKIKSQVKIFV